MSREADFPMMAGRPAYTVDQVLARARQKYPRASPAWLGTLVKILMTVMPEILALFMGDRPATAEQHAALAAAVDVTPGEHALMRGPLADPYISAVGEYVRKLATEDAPAAIDFAVAYAERLASSLTP